MGLQAQDIAVDPVPIAVIPQGIPVKQSIVLASATLDPAHESCLVLIDQIAWPEGKDHAFDYVGEVSFDSGKSWIVAAIGNVADENVPARNGKIANQIRIGFDLPGKGGLNRLIRFSTTFSKDLTISGSIAAK